MKSYNMFNTSSLVDQVLDTTNIERDLWITLSSDLKWKRQATSAAGKANRVLGMLKNTFVSRESTLWKKLYTTYVRPHLEFAISVWSPYRKGDMDILEKVQRRATKVAHELRGLSYVNRCKKLKLTSLVERRRRGDLIQMFKVIQGRDSIRWEKKTNYYYGEPRQKRTI